MSEDKVTLIGLICVAAILLGLFARDIVGVELGNILLMGGVIAGCVNVIIAFIGWFK